MQKEHKKHQLHLVMVFSAIFAASLVIFLLAGILTLLGPLCGQLLYPISYQLYLLRAIVHPILEAIMTKELRSVLQNGTTQLKACCRRKKVENDHRVTKLNDIATRKV